MDDGRSASPNPSPFLWLVLALLVCGVFVTLGYKLWPLLYPEVAEVAEINRGCDLRQGACEVVFGTGGSVVLDIRPRGVPPAVPLSLSLEVQGLEVESVEVDFAGVDMYMGFNRIALSERSPRHYEGRGMIPVCVRDRMTWEARVLLLTPRGLLAAPFRFDTVR
ncbi:hypothetical protein G3480_09340 [Thiorhodococcus mannitoliphagus]|uniref:Uncharacterized protein n=1 Tax=Thiorhodococcus mannitoliphagus TaxID=329406 RepID=A0A6P1DSR0_9GAMM|nr:hypothetical protein [Thiorhodococcus mannitoliphagus]NEX20510.1 hypothetical protein [Thiorhodococcus mannitoliphagus]